MTANTYFRNACFDTEKKLLAEIPTSLTCAITGSKQAMTLKVDNFFVILFKDRVKVDEFEYYFEEGMWASTRGKYFKDGESDAITTLKALYESRRREKRELDHFLRAQESESLESSDRKLLKEQVKEIKSRIRDYDTDIREFKARNDVDLDEEDADLSEESKMVDLLSLDEMLKSFCQTLSDTDYDRVILEFEFLVDLNKLSDQEVASINRSKPVRPPRGSPLRGTNGKSGTFMWSNRGEPDSALTPDSIKYGFELGTHYDPKRRLRM